jgi:hypothetical protein
VSAVCRGHYVYELALFGSNVSINDTWNITVNNSNLRIGVGLRIQPTIYNSFLPAVVFVGSDLLDGEIKLNVQGEIAQTFGSVVMPD